jgi:hypothetical protein
MLADGRQDSRFYGSGQGQELIAELSLGDRHATVIVEGLRSMEHEDGTVIRSDEDYRQAFSTDQALYAASAGEGGWYERNNNWFVVEAPSEEEGEPIEDYMSAILQAVEQIRQ